VERNKELSWERKAVRGGVKRGRGLEPRERTVVTNTRASRDAIASLKLTTQRVEGPRDPRPEPRPLRGLEARERKEGT